MKDIKIFKEQEHTVNSNNEHINEDNLIFAKRTMMFDAIRNHHDLVTEERFFPERDLEKVMLTLDVVIIDRMRYDRLIASEKKSFESRNFTETPNLKA